MIEQMGFKIFTNRRYRPWKDSQKRIPIVISFQFWRVTWNVSPLFLSLRNPGHPILQNKKNPLIKINRCDNNNRNNLGQKKKIATERQKQKGTRKDCAKTRARNNKCVYNKSAMRKFVSYFASEVKGFFMMGTPPSYFAKHIFLIFLN